MLSCPTITAVRRGRTQIRERAGWWRDEAEARVHLFTAAGMRDALKGFDFNQALDVLQAEGALVAPGAGGERAMPQRIGKRPTRVYQIFPEKLLIVRASQ